MAVLDALPGVEITLVANGQNLTEHQDVDIEHSDSNSTSYIEAAFDQVFEIHLKVQKGFHFKGDCLSVRICIDGEDARSLMIFKERCSRFDFTKIIMGVRLVDGREGKFCFSILDIAADGRMFTGEPQKLCDLGKIMVTVAHNTRIERLHQSTRSVSAAYGIVSEKAVKGRNISHRVEYIPSPRVSKRAVWKTRPVDPLEPVAGRFNFLYRSNGVLKSMGIVARTPTPPPLEERDVTTLTVEELRELQRRVKSLQERENTIKREEENAAKVIKREMEDNNPRPRKVARPHAGSTQLEVDDDGSIRELSSGTVGSFEREVVEID